MPTENLIVNTVNVQVREYVGKRKYGTSHSITIYNLTTKEVYEKIKTLFKETKHDP